MIDDDAPADEGPDEKVEKIGEITTAAEDEFGGTGGRRVVFEKDGKRQHRPDFIREVDPPPLVHRAFRRADLVCPVPQFERGRDTDTRDPAAHFQRKIRRQAFDALGNEFQDSGHSRPGIGPVQRTALTADEIHEHKIGRTPPDLEAEGIGSVRIERHRDRRLADAAALRLAALEQPVLLERAHDDRDGLRRQSGQARDVGLGQRAMPANQRHHQPFIVGAHAGLARTAMDIAGPLASLSHGSHRHGVSLRLLCPSQWSRFAKLARPN